jgi:serine phosphatase RsbU (regulator of sigma subunit)
LTARQRLRAATARAVIDSPRKPMNQHKRGADRRQAPAPGNPADTADPERRRGVDRRLAGYIREIRLFAGVPHEQVEPILARCPLRHLAAGEVLLTPGQHNDAIHVLLGGELHIHLNAADSADFIRIEPGGCIGELSIIDGKPVSAYVVAGAQCTLMLIHEQAFWDQLIPLPGVARNLLKVLSDRMRLNNELIIKRLADRLKLEMLERELATASRIQASMLPSHFPLFPERGDIDLYATMEAAKEVGGDFYDAFFISPTRLFIAIGDVAGKGVPAALFMARSMTQMRMVAMRDLAPGEILARVNQALCEGNESGMFVTVFCAVLDTATGELAYSNGGHNAPLTDAAGAGFEYMVPPRGLVLGIVEGAPFGLGSLRLRPGRSVLLYTDGVTEAANPRQALYSDERLLQTLGGAGACTSARQLIDLVRADVQAFVDGAEPSDDITMLALTWHGPGPAAATLPE